MLGFARRSSENTAVLSGPHTLQRPKLQFGEVLMEPGTEGSELDFPLARNTPADHRTVPAGENGRATRSIGLLKARDTAVEHRSSGSGDGLVVGKGRGVERELYKVAFGEQARMDHRCSEFDSRSLQGLQTCNSLVDTQKLVGGKSWVLFGAHKGLPKRVSRQTNRLLYAMN